MSRPLISSPHVIGGEDRLCLPLTPSQRLEIEAAGPREDERILFQTISYLGYSSLRASVVLLGAGRAGDPHATNRFIAQL